MIYRKFSTIVPLLRNIILFRSTKRYCLSKEMKYVNVNEYCEVLELIEGMPTSPRRREKILEFR
ncbi:hypothetical protein SDJN02_08448, partial [Cucurbita argyrosperma subsp. argyrosperma]